MKKLQRQGKNNKNQKKKNLDNFCTYFVPLQRNVSWKSQMKLQGCDLSKERERETEGISIMSNK